MAADTAGAADTAVLPAGMEEAVIRAALAGIAQVRVGAAVSVTGTAVTGTVGAVAGITVMVVGGELAPQ